MGWAPDGRALLPLLAEAHADLAASEIVGDTARETELRVARGIELDRQHDALVRSINGTLLALAEGARGDEQGDKYKSAARALFPQSFGAARGTPKEEAGSEARRRAPHAGRSRDARERRDAGRNPRGPRHALEEDREGPRRGGGRARPPRGRSQARRRTTRWPRGS